MKMGLFSGNEHVHFSVVGGLFVFLPKVRLLSNILNVDFWKLIIYVVKIVFHFQDESKG